MSDDVKQALDALNNVEDVCQNLENALKDIELIRQYIEAQERMKFMGYTNKYQISYVNPRDESGNVYPDTDNFTNIPVYYVEPPKEIDDE